MGTRLQRFKPGASMRTQILLAAMMWTAVGVGLGAFGLYRLIGFSTRWTWALVTLAVVIGIVKAVFVLRKTAARTVRRILDRGDGTCIGGFFSWKSWVLVLAMMAAGRILRDSAAPIEVVGTLYLAVGIALGVGSIMLWRRIPRLTGATNG